MTHQQAYNLQEQIRERHSDILWAIYCRRSFKGPIGNKPWQVDATFRDNGEVIRFITLAQYKEFSNS